MFKNLTLDQLRQLGNKVSQILNLREFYQECFKKQFDRDIENYQDNSKTPNEKRAVLKKIYEFATKLPKKFQSFKD